VARSVRVAAQALAHLDDAEPGSPESARLFAEFERTRDEYMAVFREREAIDPE
jgi:hypothetical protein